MKKIILLLFGLTIMVNINAQSLDSLKHENYLRYAKTTSEAGQGVVSEAQWNEIHAAEYKYEDFFPTSPGSYLIKAKNQMIGGFMISALSLSGVVVNTSLNSDGDSYKAINYAMGGLSLVGLIFELSGIVNIGKAGIALNNNGIGINIKF